MGPPGRGCRGTKKGRRCPVPSSTYRVLGQHVARGSFKKVRWASSSKFKNLSWRKEKGKDERGRETRRERGEKPRRGLARSGPGRGESAVSGGDWLRVPPETARRAGGWPGPS